MKAARFYAIGDVRIEEIDKPQAPIGGALMKVGAALTCGTDVKMYKRGHWFAEEAFKLYGDKCKGIPFGHECSGTIVELGEGAQNFKVGDRIALFDSAYCGNCYYCKSGLSNLCENRIGFDGAFAEYVSVPKEVLNQSAFLMPDNMSFTAGALLEPTSCAVHGIDQSGIRTGDVVVINGAGPIGLAMVRTAYLKGAHIICCDLSDERLETAKRLGAHDIVNAALVKDQVEAVRSLTPYSRGVDVAIEATGVIDVWEKTTLMVRKGGIVTLFGGVKGGSQFKIDPMLLHYSQLTIKGIFATTPKNVEMAFSLIKHGEISPKDFVTGKYKLDDIVKAIEAHAAQIGVKNEIICNEE